MNIAHILDERFDSGLSHYALTLAEGQARAGNEVSVWAPKSSPACEAARKRGVAVVALNHPFLRLAALRRQIRKSKIEVLNAHTGSGHTLAVLLSSAKGPAVVRTRADARVPRPRMGLAWLYARTQGFIAANEAVLAEAERTGPLPAARAVVHQGLDPEGPFRPSPIPPGAPVGIVARLDPVKGHEDFLAAAALCRARLPELEFVVAGPEANVTADRLRSLAAELGISDGVRFAGHVDDVAALMRTCRFGVVASRASEAVSRVALEWMACGRPLVATQVGALPELVDEGVTGLLVPPAAPAALAEAIVRLASAPPLAAAMGARARERFASRFSLAAFVAATENVYRRALAAEGAPKA